MPLAIFKPIPPDQVTGLARGLTRGITPSEPERETGGGKFPGKSEHATPIARREEGEQVTREAHRSPAEILFLFPHTVLSLE